MSVRILTGDCRDILKTLPEQSVQCVVTSPPYYGLRDYGDSDQIGLENSVDEYIAEMVSVFREVRRVLRDDGTLWLNLGDSYNGTGKKDRQVNSPKQDTNRGAVSQRGTNERTLKPKDLIGIPWRVALALQADGWWLRQDIIWAKPNPMPESVTDRCTKAHEYVFLLTKSARYNYDHEAVKEPAITGNDLGILRGKRDVGKDDGVSWHAPSIAKRQSNGVDSRTAGDGTRNKRSVWTIPSSPYKDAHFATFPPDLVDPCIKAGSAEGDTVLDPFGGAGTVGLVADRLSRDAILIELNPTYAELARRRIADDSPMFAKVEMK